MPQMAGAAAAAGAPLSAVADVARRVASSCVTYGAALSICTLPGHKPNTRLRIHDIELGLGIHGEPGAAIVPLMAARELANALMARLVHYQATQHLFSQAGTRVVLLVNNLGATSPMELSVVAGEAVRAAQEHKLSIIQVLCGPFMTSLDMKGVSLTLLAIQPDMEPLLAAPAAAPAWPHHSSSSSSTAAPVQWPIRPVPLPAGLDETAEDATHSQGICSDSYIAAMSNCVRAAATTLVRMAPLLNEYDSKVGDGDCGDTLLSGAHAILTALDAKTFNLNTPAATLHSIAAIVRQAMGGTSGGLYDVAFTAAAGVMQLLQQQGRGSRIAGAGQELGVAAWGAAFAAGVSAVERYGGAAAGCRTMLDALLPAAAALNEAAAAGPIAAAAAAAAAAEGGAEATKSMRALAGRASYVPPEVLGSTPDPGAVAAAAWLRKIAEELAKHG
eukprot:GHRR01013729.1.p1 GENE.GHRR01013729.1~~GHRR01013729.1.p1  ORF type:complete len:445 (+),score=205.35 GHRR01013729.1:165-1499(+)